MAADNLITRLAELTLQDRPALETRPSAAAKQYEGGGEDAIMQLWDHLQSVRLRVSAAGSSKSELGEVARRHVRELLKTAQAGLRNKVAGSEPLCIAYEAMRILIPLIPFAGVGDLVAEKLWYQAIARSVDIGDFELGLRSSAFFQLSLRERGPPKPLKADSRVDATGAEGIVVGEGDATDVRGDPLILRAFGPPTEDTSLGEALLIDGASLNACRCCLEVGSRETLALLTGELGRSAGLWIDAVSARGEGVKAESHRDHLFRLLWRACSAAEHPTVAMPSLSCLSGRQNALGVFLQKKDSWNVDTFIAYAHRGAIALEHLHSDSASVADAAKLGTFCLKSLVAREGAQWPAGDAVRGTLQHTWVDWLQHSAGLQQKAGNGEEAQRVIQIAYEYVRCCSSQTSGNPRSLREATRAAYASALMINTSSMLVSPAGAADVAVSVTTPVCTETPGKARARRKLDASKSDLACTHVARGLEYLDAVGIALEALAEDPAGETDPNPRDAATFLAATFKAWKWAQRACGLCAACVSGDVSSGRAFHDASPGWSELRARAHQAVGKLSRHLAARRELAGRTVERIPPASAITELAVDSYLRAAGFHLEMSEAPTSPSTGHTASPGRGLPTASNARRYAREALVAADELAVDQVYAFTCPQLKRAGVEWYILGTSLMEGDSVRESVDALVRACHFLERWVEAEVSQSGTGAAGDTIVKTRLLRAAQLDLRLSKVAKILQESGQSSAAIVALARAMAFCPDIWNSPDEDQAALPAGLLALMDRHVACRLRCSREAATQETGRGQSKRTPAGARGNIKLSEAAAAYLWGVDSPRRAAGSGSDEYLYTLLQKRGCPLHIIASIRLAECRAYLSHMNIRTPSRLKSTADEVGVHLSACVEGHRRCTTALIKTCGDLSRAARKSGEDVFLMGTWEARARIEAAIFEHCLLLVDMEASEGVDSADDGAGGARIMADAQAGIHHTEKGSEVASRLVLKNPLLSSPADALDGVCACVRALLLRDSKGDSDDVRAAMHQGLEAFTRAARGSKSRMDHPWLSLPGLRDLNITSHLQVLGRYYTLQSDIVRKVRAAEIIVALSNVRSAKVQPICWEEASASAMALRDIGAAFRDAGFPAAGSAYCTVTDAWLCREGVQTPMAQVAADDDHAYARARVEAACAAIRVLGEPCQAELSGNIEEAEEALVKIGKEMCDRESRILPPAMAAHLECVVGMELSRIHERSGRLGNAMEMLRQVLHLCHAWASAGASPPPSLDVQIVVQSASKGSSVHDEPSTRDDGAGRGVDVAEAVEEGVGEETTAVEGTLIRGPANEGVRETKGVSLGSQWIPMYLDCLVHMGRLWRSRGFASKASGYLRQGCVASEPLEAARFVRKSLLEEVEVAAGLHRFSRAERLLLTCQALLQEERQAASSEEDGAQHCCTKCGTSVFLNPLDSGKEECPAARTRGPRQMRKRAARGVMSAQVALDASDITPSIQCLGCWEFTLHEVDLASTEAALLRKQDRLAEALAACQNGERAVVELSTCTVNGPLPAVKVLGVQLEHAVVMKADGKHNLGRGVAEVVGKLRLQRGRIEYLLGNVVEARKAFAECSRLEGTSGLLRAEALYWCGRLCLDAADAPGARPLLERAEALVRDSGAPELVRNTRRALALALAESTGHPGSARVHCDASWKVAAQVSLSIGITHCNQVLHASSRRIRKGQKTVHDDESSAALRLFQIVGGNCVAPGWKDTAEKSGHPEPQPNRDESCLQHAIASQLEEDWPIVSLCLAPGPARSGHLLLTRLTRDRPPLTLSVPLSAEEKELLDRWRQAMDENHQTLRGHSAEEAAGWGSENKAAWWERRAAVDETLEEVLRALEERWLAPHCLSAAMLGEVVDETLNSELESAFDFAKSVIERAVHSGETSAPRRKPRRRCRASPAGSPEPDVPVGGRVSVGVLEFIRLSVRGGPTICDQVWRTLVRLALSDEADAETVDNVACEIWRRLQIAYTRAETNGLRRHVQAPLAGVMSDEAQLCAEIEGGRSACVAAFEENASTAAQETERECPRTSVLTEADLSKMKVADLRRELSARGIAVTGLKLKAALLSRLMEAVRDEVRGRSGHDGSSSDEDTARNDLDRTHSHQDIDFVNNTGAPACAGRCGGPSISSREQGSARSASVDVGRGGRGATSETFVERHPVILVLDEELQAIPWEGLPCLRGHPVTRVPAVPFVFSALEARWPGADCARYESKSSTEREVVGIDVDRAWSPAHDGVRPHRGFYILDPEANLPHTRRHLGPVFDELQERLGWAGVSGVALTEEDMREAISGVDLLAYCGHGAGELLLGRDAVATMTQCAAVILMGCSSGRLKRHGDFEPSGMASSYLIGGSPAVVANLWDVTDKDIDRYSLGLLEAFIGGEGEPRGRARTLAHAVAQARSNCKMPFIVGHAPVCYGIPLAATPISPS